MQSGPFSNSSSSTVETHAVRKVTPRWIGRYDPTYRHTYITQIGHRAQGFLIRKWWAMSKGKNLSFKVLGKVKECNKHRTHKEGLSNISATSFDESVRCDGCCCFKMSESWSRDCHHHEMERTEKKSLTDPPSVTDLHRTPYDSHTYWLAEHSSI